MSIYELNQDQLCEVYQFFLMELVNDNRISWETMAARLYDDTEKHKKTLYNYFGCTSFTEDDFFTSSGK